MLKLWQWHNVTATGEAEIIARAKDSAKRQHERYVELAKLGPEKIDSINDAIQYFENHELGSVSDRD